MENTHYSLDEMIAKIGKTRMAKYLNMSRPTLDARIREGWPCFVEVAYFDEQTAIVYRKFWTGKFYEAVTWSEERCHQERARLRMRRVANGWPTDTFDQAHEHDGEIISG